MLWKANGNDASDDSIKQATSELILMKVISHIAN